MKKQYQRVLVLGLGLSGRAVAKYLLGAGSVVAALDQNVVQLKNHPEVRDLMAQGLSVLSEEQCPALSSYTALVVSPGIPRSHPIVRRALRENLMLVGESELACSLLKQPAIAVTGTNGKSTVVSLISHILNASGKPARVVGNIGIPLISQINGSLKDILIVELSSYQLEMMHHPVFQGAAILNITPDHLDRYRDFEEYVITKFRIKNCLKTKAPLFVHESCLQQFPALCQDSHIKAYGFSSGLPLSCNKDSILIDENVEYFLPVGYKGQNNHHVENVIAACGLTSLFAVSPQQFTEAVESFEKLPHRIELVRTFSGVAYYDDSKGTNIDAVMKAVASLDGKVVLIAGGVDKGASYDSWVDAFKGKVSHICLIGEASEKISEKLGDLFSVERVDSLNEAVQRAKAVASDGENVLLSPGCASFDMFESYEHRGNEFKKIVHDL